MLNQHAAIAGSFADYRLIKSRGVLQIVVEVPVERQAEAFAALGYPVPGADIHVAVARLVSSGAGAEPERITQAGPRTTPAVSAPADAGGRTAGSPPANQKGPAAISARSGDATEAETQPDGEPHTQPLKHRRPFHTLPPAQRAALLCQDARFQAWAAQRDGLNYHGDEMHAASWLREAIGVKSRAEIATDPAALRSFERIETEYMQDTGLMARAG